MRNARLHEAQAGIKIAGRNINNLRYADDTIIMAQSEEELQSFLMRVEEESGNAGLKLSTKEKTKIMASGPITSWQIEGVKVEAVTDFLFLRSKITVIGDCSHEIKRHFILGRKAMTNIGSILKSRDITSLTKVRSVQFSLSVGYDSLRPHGLQHARPSCPSSTPGAYSNSCPLSQ